MKYFLSMCVGSIVLLMAAGAAMSSGYGKNLNIVLITIDTLRADHLSCYGYERNTTPHIDKIALKGMVFKNASAPSSYTVPSMASLFTSLYPTNHGVLYGRLSDFYPEVFKQFEKKVNPVIPGELTTLAEILRLQGYTTFGVSSNLLLDEATGFAKGFDYFRHADSPPASDINKIVFSLEADIRKSDRFFLWVHYMDPHFPYRPRDPWIEHYTPKALTQKLKLYEKHYKELMKLRPALKKDQQALSNLIALYDSEINFVDFHVGELIQKLDLDKGTLLIITSDHGEEFLEHGCLTHGNNLYNETIRVPLIVKLPDGTGKIVEEHVNLIDIMPTILSLLDVDHPKHMLGKSFLQEEGWIPWLKKLFLSKDESDYTFAEISKENVLKAVMWAEWKYIYDYRNNKELLYNTSVDPLEHDNLMDTQTGQGIQLKEKLIDWASNLKTYSGQEQSFKLTPEEEEKLKSIGYLQ